MTLNFRHFKHYLDTRNGDEFFELIDLCGVEGYGIWWLIVEELYNASSNEFRIAITPTWLKRIGRAGNVDPGVIRSAIAAMAQVGLICSQHYSEGFIFVPSVKQDIEFRLSQIRDSSYRRHQYIVFERDGYRCVYCGSSNDLTLDHVIPQSRGGSHEPENLACCCSFCNSSKRDRTPEEWRSAR